MLCFRFDEPAERDQAGSFQIIVEAVDPLAAVDLCRSRLRALRRAGDLFHEPVTIYIEGVVGLSGPFSVPVVVNYDVGDAPTGPVASLCSFVPLQAGAPELNEWEFDPDPSVKRGSDGSRVVPPFLDFGGQAIYAARAKTRSSAAALTRGLSTDPSVSSTGAARRSPRSKQSAVAKARNAAVAATLAELSGKPSKR